ncbi:unnamed protein product [Somion occarium]|uniref:Uncharacterized protein n=1 Tax=Somion occarium TaxID=3059160 RepID=A0ABP1E070_9APHY
MGFFSGRRPEDIAGNIEQPKSVVRVIRSRFYGKQAGKSRSSHGPEPSSSSSHDDSLRSHLSSSPYPERPSATTLSHVHASSTMRPTASRLPSSPSSPRTRPINNMTTTSRPSTDAITLTLAQRLQELATANAEGLLSDDEYRLLRQDLFDRLAGGSTVPTEAPVIPVISRNAASDPGPSRHSRQTSHYDTQSTRAPSTTSKRSISSTVTGMLKRATSKRRGSGATEYSDTASIFSTTSTAQRSVFQRPLAKQSSEASLAPESPRLSRADSVMRPPNLKLNKDRSNSMTRSVRSLRKGAMPPPSAFQQKHAPETYVQTAPIDGSADDELLRSTDDIRREIEAVEAEGRRLLDAFSGLELSTLVKQQRNPGLMLSSTESNLHLRASSSAGQTRMDIDSNSIRSTGSGLTMLSINRPPGVEARLRRNASNSGPSSLYRKNSVSTMSTHSKTGNTISPTSPSSRHLGRSRLGSTSSVNLARSASHLPLAPVAERADTPHRTLRVLASEPDAMSEAGGDDSVDEMNDIRRRKAEVTARYETRVEYLRARLKGAELREKLLKT